MRETDPKLTQNHREPGACPSPVSPSASASPTQSPVVDSRELLGGKQELQISHEGEVYRLRVTRNGRLILNK